MKEIEVKGKKYPLLDDFDYVYVKKFRKIVKQYDKGELDDPDEDMILLFAEAICPSLKIKKDDMSVDGKKMTFGEVKKLVVDLRTAFDEIRSDQIDGLLKEPSNGGSKNVQEAVKTQA